MKLVKQVTREYVTALIQMMGITRDILAGLVFVCNKN